MLPHFLYHIPTTALIKRRHYFEKDNAFFILSLMGLALLVVLMNSSFSNVKAQTQRLCVRLYFSRRNDSTGSTNLTGGTTYNYTNGQSVQFTANPVPGCKFLFWAYASPAGTNISTNNPFVYNISSTECAIQAMFIPNTNATLSSNSTQSGIGPFNVPIHWVGHNTRLGNLHQLQYWASS